MDSVRFGAPAPGHAYGEVNERRTHHGRDYAFAPGHPHTPPKPGVLKTAGVAAAAVDKMRDIATGRGKDGKD